ncbi:VOC family protein [Vibrio sp.]|uniref:VOC family protein n=1 Tax=Vibrio sp. TaxID=678 RepID=UPI003D106520
MISGFHHIQISIPIGSETTARNFYAGTLRLTEIEKPEYLRKNGGLWFEVGSLQLHLGCENNKHRASTKAHVAYQVTDLAYWRNRLDEQGVAIAELVAIEGMDRFEVRDPFGNRIELLQIKKRAT